MINRDFVGANDMPEVSWQRPAILSQEYVPESLREFTNLDCSPNTWRKVQAIPEARVRPLLNVEAHLLRRAGLRCPVDRGDAEGVAAGE